MLAKDRYVATVLLAALPPRAEREIFSEPERLSDASDNVNQELLERLRRACGNSEHVWQQRVASLRMSDNETKLLLHHLEYAHQFQRRCRLGYLHKIMSCFWQQCEAGKAAQVCLWQQLELLAVSSQP